MKQSPWDWKKLVMRLQALMDAATESGEECGCQLAIYWNGQQVLSLVSGYTTPERSVKIDEQSLFPVFSVGKGIMATAFHRLREKGKISCDTRVADLWPEFGCCGKENIRVRDILTHREALFELPEYGRIEELADWELMCRRMEKRTPAWPPGGKCRYHPITYAWLLGETAHRADGRPFSQIIREEVLKPLQLDSFFFGTSEEADRRFVPVDVSSVKEGRSWHTDFMHNPVIRHGFLPSANGCANASSIARHYAALLGEVDGVRLLRPETVADAAVLRRAPEDPVPPEGTWEKFGLGYALCGPADNPGALFGHGGALGAEGFADRTSGIAVGFTKNKVISTHPVHPIRDRISELLGLPVRHW